jgi:hypothetical protein
MPGAIHLANLAQPRCGLNLESAESKRCQAQTMKPERTKAAGAPRTAPLPGQESLTTFTCAPNDRVAIHEAFRVGLDFQTCRMVDSPKSTGRKAAPAVGLEICATSDARS